MKLPNTFAIQYWVWRKFFELVYQRYTKISCATRGRDENELVQKDLSTFLRFYSFSLVVKMVIIYSECHRVNHILICSSHHFNN